MDMTIGWFQIALYIALLLLLVKPLGAFMAHVYTGERTFLSPVLGPLERLLYRLAGIDANAEMNWRTYAVALLIFNGLGMVVLYLLQRAQAWLPLNPAQLDAVDPWVAFNTAASFTSNTNWQFYGGETTMSYLTQMVGLNVQNFVSAAMGMAVLVALIRGIGRQTTQTIGNFWVDLTRSTIYILLPLSLILALALVSQGVVQTFAPYQTTTLLQPTTDVDGNAVTEQMLALGPAASQVAIKQLGTNGGGFFNVNSAHPFENPTPLSNLLEMLALLLIPASLCYTFGKMVGDVRQGWALLIAMTVVFVAFLAVTYTAEQAGNPQLAALGVDQSASALQTGGNMEGKEVRFGIANSALWATATTAASNGSVNSMHDSYTPLGSLAPMLLMQLGEVIFGGVGSGLYGLLMFVIVGVFVAGLMVGRTPEYLSKKIEAYEMKMASLVILIPPALVLLGTALATVLPFGLAAIQDGGPHTLSELLYAYTSQANNNGSAFAGISVTPLFALSGGLAMLFARFWLAVPVLAIAGSLAGKKKVPVGAGTLPTHTPLFVLWLIMIVLVVGALAFFPVLALGPIVEQLMMQSGISF
jgi:potassium-transporting ATPase potassium-binding subunit